MGVKFEVRTVLNLYGISRQAANHAVSPGQSESHRLLILQAKEVVTVLSTEIKNILLSVILVVEYQKI